MLQYINLKIDGVNIRAAKGTTVLDAAFEYGICIPNLCHVPNLSNIGACRICIVEQIVNGRSKVTTSCTLLVQEGMIIKSNTDKIRNLRRNIAELLVAQAPNSKAIQDIAVRCGVKKVRYPFRNEKCVLCGRCVRACTELFRAKAIGFVGRGKNRHIDSPFGVLSEFCKRCGACIDLCPMTITPCSGPMKPGKERLCGECESQLYIADKTPDHCVWCELGKGFQCGRY
ncbi:MAG: (2Fe-2S)-binding protein [Desulfobacterales bacterium]|nr:(2Fe-2S)-binding protein [Desulfobacterales bacterium]